MGRGRPKGAKNKLQKEMFGKPAQRLAEDGIMRSDSRGMLIISPIFNETLFRLWLNGKGRRELISMFMGTDKEFNDRQLKHAIETYGWKKRKETLMNAIEKESDKQILRDKQKQLNAMSMILDMNVYAIESAYVDFVNNPQEFFKDPANKEKYWMINDLSKLKDLFLYFKEMTKKEEPATSSNNENKGMTSNIFIQNQAEARDKIISALKEAADSRHVELFKTNQLVVEQEKKLALGVPVKQEPVAQPVQNNVDDDEY